MTSPLNTSLFIFGSSKTTVEAGPHAAIECEIPLDHLIESAASMSKKDKGDYNEARGLQRSGARYLDQEDDDFFEEPEQDRGLVGGGGVALTCAKPGVEHSLARCQPPPLTTPPAPAPRRLASPTIHVCAHPCWMLSVLDATVSRQTFPRPQ